jgi:hypothetical protein
MSYDQNSPDAMFSRIMEKLDKLDHKTDRIEVQTNLTNGRVGGLERWRDVITAKVVGITIATSTILSAIVWAIQRFI